MVDRKQLLKDVLPEAERQKLESRLEILQDLCDLIEEQIWSYGKEALKKSLTRLRLEQRMYKKEYRLVRMLLRNDESARTQLTKQCEGLNSWLKV